MKSFFKSQAIQLPSDDEDELGSSNLSSGFIGCVPCLPFLAPLNGIQLTAEDATLNDYVDPNTSPTNQSPFEELDAQDRDSAFNHATLHNSHQFLTRNPFASSPTTKTTLFKGVNKDDSCQEHHGSFAGALPRVDFFMENDNDGDAEFLSDHRISAIIGDTSKLASQLELFDSQVGNTTEDDNTLSLEADDPALTRPFEIGGDWTQDIDSIDDNSSDTNDIDTNNNDEITNGRQIGDINNSNSKPINLQDDIPLDNKVESPGGSTSSVTELNGELLLNNDNSDDEVTEEVVSKLTPPLLASSPLSPLPTVSTNLMENSNNSLPTQVVAPLPNQPPAADYHQLSIENNDSLPSDVVDSAKYQNSSPLDNISKATPSLTTETSTDLDDSVIGKRRSSVAAVAHSLLGDKLDDFTEKLAYIRKNIIMSLDDDDEYDDDNYKEDSIESAPQRQQQLRRSRSGSMQPDERRQSYDPFVSKHVSSNEPSSDPRTAHRRSNSMMDIAPSFAKMVQQIGGTEGKPDYRHFSPSSFFASLAGPDLPTSSEPQTTHPQSRQESSASPRLPQYPSTSYTTQHDKANHTDPSSDVDEEDLFDFSKVIAMGKNVRHYSEDLMGNGLRLFNDFSTRMKNANAARMTHDQLSSISQHQEQLDHGKQPYQTSQQEQSSMDQEFLLGDTFF